MAHYLVAASPLAGHVTPMLGIATDLRRRGHSVTFVTGARYHDAIVERGLRAVALPEEAHPREPVPSALPWRGPSIIESWRSGRADMRSVFITPLCAQYRTIRAELERDRPDAVVVDLAFTGALPLLIAERHRPPVVVCGVSPLMLSSVDTPPFGMGWHPRPGFDYGAMNAFVHHVLFADVQTRLNAELRRLDVGRSPVFLSDWPKLADRVLQLTVPGAEYRRSDLPSSVIFTGPVVADELGEAPSLATWQSRLTTSPTVVHVTQGTWDNGDLGQLIAPTLQALADRDDLLVIATTGAPERSLPAAVIPANAYVTDWVPYASLLPHVDVMITNGGYGGVQHALSHGIPLIVAGRTADKPEIAARVEYIGAGIDLKTERPSAAALAAAVRRILTVEDYRAAARRVSHEMAATAPFDTIADVLARLHVVGDRPPLVPGT